MEQLKRCSKCGRELPEEQFYMRRGKRIARCKECQKEYQRNRHERKKREEKQREKKPCETCIYRTYIGESEKEVACYYIAITGRRRRCPVEKCLRYQQGEQLTKKKAEFHI